MLLKIILYVSSRLACFRHFITTTSSGADTLLVLPTLPAQLAALHPLPSQRKRAIQVLSESVNGNTNVARTVEQHIFVTTLMQSADYAAKVLQLAWNLKQNGDFLLASYEPAMLVHLDDAVLAQGTAAAEWWMQHEHRLQRQQQLLTEEAKFDEAETSAHGGLVCNRCHSRTIGVQQQQTRSADEGMTVYCTCKQCGLRWKM